jgi:hypothetical protein
MQLRRWLHAGYLPGILLSCRAKPAAHARRWRIPGRAIALNLAAARLRHIAGTAWSSKRYLNIELLKDQQMRGAITA